jgi:hypothetical protein
VQGQGRLHTSQHENLKSTLRIFENRVLRRIFGHKREEVTGDEKIA